MCAYSFKRMLGVMIIKFYTFAISSIGRVWHVSQATLCIAVQTSGSLSVGSTFLQPLEATEGGSHSWRVMRMIFKLGQELLLALFTASA